LLIQIIVWISNLSKPGALIITRDGETAFVGPYARLSTVEVSTLADELRPWDPVGRDSMPEFYPKANHDVLTAKRINKDRVGMEIGPKMRVHLSYDDFTDLMGRMTTYEIVDAGPAIWPLRMVKSPHEIERLRQACAINSTAFERAIRSIHTGMTEMALPVPSASSRISWSPTTATICCRRLTTICGCWRRKAYRYFLRSTFSITIGGFKVWPSWADIWIFLMTSIPRVTWPKAAKPWPSELRLPPKSSSG